MSAISIYIHRNQENITDLLVPTKSEIASVYRSQKSSFMKNLQSTFKNKENNINNDFELNQLLDEVYQNLSDIAVQVQNKTYTGGYQLGFGKNFFDIMRSKSVSDVLFSKIDSELSNLNQYINAIENLLNQAKITFNENNIQQMVNDILINNANSSSKHIKELIQNAKRQYEGKLFTVNNQDADQYASHAANLKIYLELLKAIETRYRATGEIADGPLRRAVTNIAYAMNTVGGFLQEQVVKDAVVAAENNINAVMDSLSSAEIKISKNAQKNLISQKVTRTADVNFIYNANNSNGEGKIQINLPGVSIKKATIKNNVMPVHITSGTPLNDVIIRSKIQKKYLNSMYNIFAQFPSSKVGKNAQNFYDYISAKNILNSLVGTMNQGDFSYYLMVNQKVFKISEILDKLSKNSSDIKSEMKWANMTQTAFAKENKNEKWNNATPEERSLAVYNMIRTSTVNFSLLINGKLFS